jgi:uncharacterized protein
VLITRMRSKECRELLVRLGFGRLACASNDRPYIVPIYFCYDLDRLYCFSTVGQKITWMRQNPLVCVEADDLRAHDDWESVVVLERYVEIPHGPEETDRADDRTARFPRPVGITKTPRPIAGVQTVRFSWAPA